MICDTVEELTPIIGTRPACRALGAASATIYRRRRPPAPRPHRPRSTPARALSEAEREAVLAELHSERFVDSSPAQVWATLLDEGRYLASERTMYRLLEAKHGGVRERRDQLTHPAYAKPELLAERPNELWSWDITKLLGPAKWTYFYLFVILDVFSRYAVGWTVQHRESAALAKALIAQAAEQQQINRDQLTVHADRGSSMRSKPVAFLLAVASDSASPAPHGRSRVTARSPQPLASWAPDSKCSPAERTEASTPTYSGPDARCHRPIRTEPAWSAATCQRRQRMDSRAAVIALKEPALLATAGKRDRARRRRASRRARSGCWTRSQTLTLIVITCRGRSAVARETRPGT